MNYQHYLDLANDCAKTATYTGPSKVKLGCVAVYHGTVLAKGCNTDKTHTSQAKYNYLRYDEDRSTRYYPPKIHSEISVLSKIKYLDIDFSKVILFVAREYKNGAPALARPCASCMALIREYGIHTICYTTDDGYAIEHLK
jgi:deoxycytidylate deaminase